MIGIALSLLMAGSGPQAGTVGQAVASPSEGGLQGRRIIGPSYHLRVGVSRDGRYVAYCCTMVHEVATGRAYSVKGLRLGGTYTQAPRFSPDSEDIAYVGQESGERPPELRAVKRTGSDERVLFSSPDVRSISLIDWMPDGKNLLAAFTRVDKTTELALVPVAGGEPRRIKSPAPSSDGRLSPDGRLFAYRVQLAGAGGAWITRMSVLDGSLDAPPVERRAPVVPVPRPCEAADLPGGLGSRSGGGRGLAIGAGLLAKYAMLYFLPCALLYLVVDLAQTVQRLLPHVSDEAACQAMSLMGMEKVIAAPLFIREQILGVLAVWGHDLEDLILLAARWTREPDGIVRIELYVEIPHFRPLPCHIGGRQRQMNRQPTPAEHFDLVAPALAGRAASWRRIA